MIKRHLVTHTTDKLFKCDLCEKEFTRKGSAKKHMLVHSGIKDFQFEVCQMMFSQKLNLKRHMLTYTKLKLINVVFARKSFRLRII